MPFRIAHRIAVNRTIAGVHFPIDSAAGALLGCAIGDAVHALATESKLSGLSFGPGGIELSADSDFTQGWLRQVLPDRDVGNPTSVNNLFGSFWNSARDEWSNPKETA